MLVAIITLRWPAGGLPKARFCSPLGIEPCSACNCERAAFTSCARACVPLSPLPYRLPAVAMSWAWRRESCEFWRCRPTRARTRASRRPLVWRQSPAPAIRIQHKNEHSTTLSKKKEQTKHTSCHFSKPPASEKPAPTDTLSGSVLQNNASRRTQLEKPKKRAAKQKYHVCANNLCLQYWWHATEALGFKRAR